MATRRSLMRVKNDIAAALDNKNKGVLIMFDSYRAFDATNHDYLMNRHSLGITDTALSWLHSYMTGRYQRIAVYSATVIFVHSMDSRIIVMRMNMTVKQTLSMTEAITKIVQRLAEVTGWYRKTA